MTRHVVVAGMLALLTACSHEGKTPSSRTDGGSGTNTVERLYGKTPSDTYAAAVAAIRSFDLSIDRDWHDAMGGEVIGHRANGSTVTVKVEAVDSNNSRTEVRVEPGDSNMAQMIHEKLSDRLGTATTKGVLLSIQIDGAYYDADLKTSLNAAEQTAKVLDWVVTGKELNDVWAQLDARSTDSIPARFRIMHVDDRARRTKVTFIAGNGKTERNKTMIALMREEFDRQIVAQLR